MYSRRQAVRWQTHRQAKIRLDGTTDFLPCMLSDIGSRGCKIALKKELPIDRFFKLELVISDAFILNIEAWVAWHRVINSTNCYGIFFSRTRDIDRSRIHKFIREDLLEQVTDQLWDIEPQESFKEGGEEMADVSFSDRRIFERFPVQLPLRFLGADSGSEGQAQTYDVSAKGIGMLAKKALPLRTVLEIWLDIPDKGEPLYARGQVVWARQDSTSGDHRLGINLEKADLMGISRVLRTM